jgi:hypothetical protein
MLSCRMLHLYPVYAEPRRAGLAFPSVYVHPSLTSFRNPPAFQHSNLSARVHANPFRIRTSAKRARNPFRMRTSKAKDLNPFRIRTYEKRAGGGGLIVNQKSYGGFLSRAAIGSERPLPLFASFGANSPTLALRPVVISHGDY